ncbi:MAG TPA: S9 family peptidase [Caulobacteraceae bacterium]|nr:S9 family peptidase [Caulobacteraceae bacterium]
MSAIREIWWSGSSGMLIASKDATGSEQTELVVFDIRAERWRSLPAIPGGERRLVALGPSGTDDILAETNARDPAFFDVWRVNLRTGAAQEAMRNDRFTWLYADSNLSVRLAEAPREDGGVTFHSRAPDGGWRPLIEIPPDDEALSRPLRIYETLYAFGPGNAEVYARDSRGRDTAALAAWNLETGSTRLIAADALSDIAAAAIDPTSREVLAWAAEYDRPTITAAPGAKDVFAALRASVGEDVWPVSQSANGRKWIVAHPAADRPTNYHLFDRDGCAGVPLFSSRPDLGGLTLATMTPHLVRARDGLELVCYVTRPPGAPSGPLPLVVLIHGGPWIRDRWEFDPWIQLLANRGYAVLSTNFRGSSGLGKAFLNAGNREWGGAMLDDVIDTVRWALDEDIAAPGRIAAMGASFGGYSVLSALAREPDLFACGVDIFGVSDLVTFLQAIPAHWKALKDMWRRRVGDVDTAEGRSFLASRSPLNAADRIKAPVLILQGGVDPRVKEQESRQIAAALQARGVETTYVLFPTEGHSFFQPANELFAFACIEAFLSKWLGGAAEPFGEEARRAEARLPLGEGRLPGLANALARAG